MSKEELLRCISDFDEHCHSKRGAVCIAHKIGIEISLDHVKEVADRRHLQSYLGLSDEQVLATSLDPNQMIKFRKFYSHVPDPPAELIKPFKPFESSEPAEITELIKPTEIFEPSEVIESFAS